MIDKISTNNYKPGLDIDYVKKKYKLKRVIKLASNENPIGPSKLALKILEAGQKNINRYPDGKCDALKSEIVKFTSKTHIKTKNIIIGNGSSEILELVAKAFLTKKSEALFSKHSFIVYKLVSNFMNAKIRESNLITKIGGKFMSSDLDDMKNKITSKTKVIFLPNPANPTGALLSHNAIDEFISKISKKIIVVIDEAYIEYACMRGHKSCINLLKKYDNVIITRSFSKIYALAGVRIGYGLASEHLISKINDKRQPFNVNQIAQLMAIKSLTDTKFVKDSLRDYEKCRIYLCKELDKLNLYYIDSYANFITIKFGSETKSIFNKLLQSGIILRPLDNYKLPNYLRLTIGTFEECKIFIASLKRILDKK